MIFFLSASLPIYKLTPDRGTFGAYLSKTTNQETHVVSRLVAIAAMSLDLAMLSALMYRAQARQVLISASAFLSHLYYLLSVSRKTGSPQVQVIHDNLLSLYLAIACVCCYIYRSLV